jgi:hypothetical protein
LTLAAKKEWLKRTPAAAAAAAAAAAPTPTAAGTQLKILEHRAAFCFLLFVELINEANLSKSFFPSFLSSFPSCRVAFCRVFIHHCY